MFARSTGRLTVSVLAGFACLVACESANAQPDTTPRPTAITIDGRTHPDFLPMHVVWEHFFRLVVAVAKGDSDAFIPERLEALAKHNLLVPVDDVRLIVEVAQRSLQQSDALRAPLADEHAGRVDLDWPIEKRRAQVTASYEIIVESRDELARLLSRQSFMAVKRYIAASVVPGMTLDVNLTQR